MKPLIGTAPDEEALARVAETVRARVAFYLSTASYRRTFELHGWGEWARRASEPSRQGRWNELPHTVATIATHDRIADRLRGRYGSRVQRIEFSIPVTTADEREVLASILAALR